MDKEMEARLRAIADALAAEVLARAALIRARPSAHGRIGLRASVDAALADMAAETRRDGV